MTSLEDTLRQLEKQCFNAKDQHSKAQEMVIYIYIYLVARDNAREGVNKREDGTF